MNGQGCLQVFLSAELFRYIYFDIVMFIVQTFHVFITATKDLPAHIDLLVCNIDLLVCL